MKDRTTNPYESDLAGARFYLWATGIFGAACLIGLAAALLANHNSYHWLGWQFLAWITGVFLVAFLLLAFAYFVVRREGRKLNN